MLSHCFVAASLKSTASPGQPGAKKTEGRPVTEVFEELLLKNNPLSPLVKRRRLVRLKQANDGGQQKVSLCHAWNQLYTSKIGQIK